MKLTLKKKEQVDVTFNDPDGNNVCYRSICLEGKVRSVISDG
jgi:hypothetical protein